jgi:hypothetical protein
LTALNLTTTGTETLDGGTYTIGSGPYSFGAVTLNGAIVLGQATSFGAVTLGSGNVSLDSSAVNGLLTLGNVSGGGDTLNISTGSGGVTFNGVTLAALDVTTTGTETLDAGTYTVGSGPYSFGAVTLSGADVFGQSTSFGAVRLGADTTISTVGGSNAITFGSTVDGAHALTVDTAGTTTFDGNVGSGTVLTGLDVTAASIVLPAVVTTTTGSGSNGGSGQTYNGAVTLPVNTTLTDTGNATNITFNGTVDDTIAGTASLTVKVLSSPNAQTFSSQVVFRGAVGGIAPLGGLTVQENPNFVTEATVLGGNVTTQGGAINIETGAIIAASSVTLDTTAGNTQPLGSNVTIAGQIDGDGVAPRALTVDAGTGGAAQLLGINESGGTFGGIGLSTPLASLTVTGATIVLDAVTTTGAQTYTAGPAGSNPLIGNIGLGDGSITGGVALFGNLTSSGGAITFQGASGSQTGVFVANDLNIDTNGGTPAGGNVTFNSTIDSYYPGFVSGIANTLGINAGTSGNVSFGGAVGAGAALVPLGSSFTGEFQNVSVTGHTVTLPSAVITSGTQSYSGGVTLTANATLTGSAVTFNSTVDDSVVGTESLTVSGKAIFDKSVGGVAALSSLAVSGATTLNLSGGSITTTGNQTYTAAVTLSSDATLTSTGGGALVNFGSTVNGAHNLTIASNASFANTVGAATKLASLHVTGTTTFGANATSVGTTGGQTYSGTVTLGANTTLTTTSSGLVTLGNVVGSTDTLTISSGSGGATLNGATLKNLVITTSGPETLDAGTRSERRMVVGASLPPPSA